MLYRVAVPLPFGVEWSQSTAPRCGALVWLAQTTSCIMRYGTPYRLAHNKKVNVRNTIASEALHFS